MRLPVALRATFPLIAILCLALSVPLQGQRLPNREYWVYVAAESDDEVALVRFGPGGFEVVRKIGVGVRPTEIEGPHGLRVSPDLEHWYVSIAHGNPYGSVHKYRTGTDSWEGAAEVGMFPATMDVSQSTGLLYVANFDLHGDMTPGTISVVETEAMVEVGRVEVGVMPHGSRLVGERQYSVMMMSDELVETDAWGLAPSRRLSLSGMSPMPRMVMGILKPTWVEPSPDGRSLYVALNGSDQIREVDIQRWEVSRTFDTGPGPYNLGVSPDGRLLVATYRSGGSTGVWDLESGRELVQIRNSRQLSHGVAISPDSRFAFVSVEGVGGEPGGVDVIDLESLEIAAYGDVGKQASGIAFWKMDE